MLIIACIIKSLCTTYISSNQLSKTQPRFMIPFLFCRNRFGKIEKNFLYAEEGNASMESGELRGNEGSHMCSDPKHRPMIDI